MEMKMQCIFKIFFLVSLSYFSSPMIGQKWLKPIDTLNLPRAKTALIGTGAIYAGFSLGLYNVWYKKYDQSSFHFFNDGGEWSNMDKYGHVYSSYFQGITCYKISKWTGLSERKSIITGVVASTLFQTTIEVMDGYSTKWGFSGRDVVANLSGLGLFAVQQHYWGAQRISFKVSSIPKQYSKLPIASIDGSSYSSISNRATSLYGSGYFERFLKDYNAQVYWISADIKSFFPSSKWPRWLNIAMGYGADNMYGGFKNEWFENDQQFVLSQDNYPRIHQFYLGFDLNMTNLGIKNRTLRSIFNTLDIFKAPSPAIELNSLGQLTFHLFR
jgi:uncharacterized protein YfiM (DUF2279 family)